MKLSSLGKAMVMLRKPSKNYKRLGRRRFENEMPNNNLNLGLF